MLAGPQVLCAHQSLTGSQVGQTQRGWDLPEVWKEQPSCPGSSGAPSAARGGTCTPKAGAYGCRSLPESESDLPFKHPPCAWCWWRWVGEGCGNAKPMEDALVLAQVPPEADAKHRLVQEVQTSQKDGRELT